MTAFARQSVEKPWGTLVWELRSVNHRYLEPGFKLPEAMRVLETKLRDRLRKRLARGKIECGLRYQQSFAADQQALTINQELLQQLVDAGTALRQSIPDAAAIDPLQLLQWPGVIAQTGADSDAMVQDCLAGFDEALEELLQSRQREGEELKQFILQRVEQIADIVLTVREQLPAILQAQRQRLQQRLAELKAELDSDRLEQELVLLAQKADVDEELDRLDTHLTEVRRVLNKGGACGRRLDFLMQELNREANTLSSKSIVSDTTQAAVELKVLIEQMREQIQNIE